MSSSHASTEPLAWLLSQAPLLMLAALLVAAAYIDWRSMRIPNWLTGGGALLGLLWSAWGLPSAPQGLMLALAGLAVGMGLMLPLYLLGAMGAGDVKLMAMVGIYLGAPATLLAMLFVFVTGGLMALLGVALRRAWAPLWLSLQALVLTLLWGQPRSLRAQALCAGGPSLGKQPFGVSICVGTVASVLSQQLAVI